MFEFVATGLRASRGRMALTGPAATATLSILLLTGCSGSETRQPSIGDPVAGSVIVTRQSCGSCHEIPGEQLADGRVGPPLSGIAARVYIAGHLLNTPDNMVAWLRDPQAAVPGNAMPNVGLTDKEAHDVAAYLYRLR